MKLLNLAEKFKYTCYWCKKKFKIEDLSRDYVQNNHGRKGKMRSQGECVLACIFCNGERGNMPFHAWESYLRNKKLKHQEELKRLWG